MSSTILDIVTVQHIFFLIMELNITIVTSCESIIILLVLLIQQILHRKMIYQLKYINLMLILFVSL